MVKAHNSSRIMYNAIFLYIRMGLIMLISFYTTRILLQALGIVDYGIYNVVGGIVALIGFLTSSMTGAIQRYITYELGKKENVNVNEIFGTAVSLQLLFSLLLVILAESIGLWFLNTQMQIPNEQYSGAFWVFQASIITTVISILSTPYMSLIIAYEKMSAFAYISIIETILKLGVAFIIQLMQTNRLINYAFFWLSPS